MRLSNILPTNSIGTIDKLDISIGNIDKLDNSNETTDKLENESEMLV